LSQNRNVEINDESNRFAQQLQVGKELGIMNGKNTFHTLQLQDHDIFDNQIKPITTIKRHTFVNDGYGDLSLKAQATQVQLMAQTLFIH
jgi:hypothetical protein